MKALSRLSTAIGDGLVAGFLGTAAMTVSSTIEARLRHRVASSAPARATAKALGIADFEDDSGAGGRDLGQRGSDAARPRRRPAVRVLGQGGGRDRPLPPCRLRPGD